MPQSLSLPLIVAYLVAFVASFSRIFTASRPFWGLLPGWLQVLAPQLVLALGVLAQGLAGGIHSPTDLVVVFVAAGALLMPGAPSNRSAAPLQASKPATGTPSAGDVAVAAAMKSGSVRPPAPPPPPSSPNWPSAAVLLLLCCFGLHSSACSLFESRLPAAEKCLPTPASLLSQVTDILLAGGDYTSALEAKAQSAGEDVLLCAVKAFLGSNKVAAGEADIAARKRARAYLAAKGAQ